MTRESGLLRTAWLVYAAAWFLPVHTEGKTLAAGTVPGWEALRFALGAGWPWPVLTVPSALTNLVMLSTLRPASGDPRAAQRLGVVLWACALFNALLWVVVLNFAAGLRIGYWAWVGSFALAALALRQPGRSRGPGTAS